MKLENVFKAKYCSQSEKENLTIIIGKKIQKESGYISRVQTGIKVGKVKRETQYFCDWLVTALVTVNRAETVTATQSSC